MREGKSITELAQQLQDLRENARDFIVPTKSLAMVVSPIDGLLKLEFTNGKAERFAPNSWSHRQVATYTGVPQAYYDRLKAENPGLLASNVNHGLAMHKDERRLVRTYRDGVRAMVSDRYRRLDSVDLLETVAPILIESGMQVLSSELTDMRMYLQVTTPRLKADVKVGDTVQYGLVVSSSDVGAGSVRVEPLLYRLVCTNGMITSAAIRKFHIGKAAGEGDDPYELYSDATRSLTDQAFWAQVRDVVLASLNPAHFEKQVDKLRLAAGQAITNFDLPQVVELAARHVGVSGDKVKQSVVAYLANGADGAGLTRWGLANAFTAAANADHVSYDDSVDLERVGAQIIDLPKSAWNAISQVAA